MEFKFKIGASVFTREGEAGRLKFLVIDPREEAITSLIVERGRLLHRDLVVPVSWVEKSDEQAIVLNASARELEELPEYREVEYRTPEPTARLIAGHPLAETLIWIGSYPGVYQPERALVSHRERLGITEEEVLVKRGQPVYSADGYRLATLDHVLVDDKTHRLRHLIVHQGRWLQRGEELVVPVEAVSRVMDSSIRVKVKHDELDKLARYRPTLNDIQLERAITRGLETQPETKGQDLRVQIDRGLVRLFGGASEAIATTAQTIVSKIQGIVGVEDHTTRPKAAADAAATPASANDKAIAAQI